MAARAALLCALAGLLLLLSCAAIPGAEATPTLVARRMALGREKWHLPGKQPTLPEPPRKKVCFPGHATVQLADGKLKTMEELDLGDKVAVWDEHIGRIAYDDVYAFGHKDALGVSLYVKIGMDAAASLELSPRHFVPTVQAGITTYKRAQDVVLGDYLWVTNATGEGATLHAVTEISSSLKQGAFNPFTAQGNIVVDGVVASVHSDWFLDSLFSYLGLLHFLPAVYQVLLTPARLLYTVLGKSLYTAIYNGLDARFNLAELGTDHGGHVVLATAVAGLLAVTFASNMFTSKRSRTN